MLVLIVMKSMMAGRIDSSLLLRVAKGVFYGNHSFAIDSTG